MAGELANPIVSKAKEVATRLGAILIVDGPETSAEAKTFRDLNGGDFVYICSPKVKVAAGNQTADVPMSSYVAGVMAKNKFWQSPSNQLVQGILGTSRPISFSLDDPKSEGQILNSHQVATVVRQDGFRIWGARGSGDQTDLSANQIQKVRIRNAIREAIKASHRWAIAMGITRDYFIQVATSVNAYLSDLQKDTAILGGACWADPERNTPEAIADGKAYWKFKYTPLSVGETLTFEESITLEYYEGLAG